VDRTRKGTAKVPAKRFTFRPRSPPPRCDGCSSPPPCSGSGEASSADNGLVHCDDIDVARASRHGGRLGARSPIAPGPPSRGSRPRPRGNFTRGISPAELLARRHPIADGTEMRTTQTERRCATASPVDEGEGGPTSTRAPQGQQGGWQGTVDPSCIYIADPLYIRQKQTRGTTSSDRIHIAPVRCRVVESEEQETEKRIRSKNPQTSFNALDEA
jgi:hypothetical protein